MSLRGVDKVPYGSASCRDVLIMGLFLSPLHELVCVYPEVAEVLAKQRERQGTRCRFCAPCCACSSKVTSHSGVGLRLDLRTCSNDSGLVLFLFLCKPHCSVSSRTTVQESISLLAKGDEMAEESAEMPVMPHVCCLLLEGCLKFPMLSP